MASAQSLRVTRVVRDYIAPTFAMITVAAGCLFLGRWQWDAAFAHQGRQMAGASAELRPLADLTSAEQWLPRASIGARTEVTGTLLQQYTFTTNPRPTADGVHPWVVTPLRTDDGDVIAVVRGAGTPLTLSARVSVVGRLQPSEDSPAIGAWKPAMAELSTGALVDRWPFAIILDGYLIAEQPAALTEGTAASPRFTAAPSGQVSWRNLAYAVQWGLFAVFAAFVWWRHLVTLREGG